MQVYSPRPVSAPPGLLADRTMRRAMVMMAAFSLLQGLPAYFFSVGLPALLRDAGASLSMVGLTYVIWLPLAFQWLWAPAFDAGRIAPFGSRLNWLRALPVLLALVFALVAVFPPGGNSAPLLAVSFLCSAITATIRILLGAWVIHGANASQRAYANAAGVAAMLLGGIAGGAAMLHVGQNYSWTLAIAGVCAVIVLLSLPAWLVRDEAGFMPATPAARGGMPGRWRAAWAGFFTRAGIWRMIALVLCFGMVSGADVLVPAIMVDRGYSPTDTLWILGTFAMAAVIPATALIGAMIRRHGTLKVLAVLYALKLVVLGGLTLHAALSPGQVAVLAVADYFLSGVLTVATWQIFMNFASGSASATDFSLVTSIDALLRSVGGIVAGQIAENLGYATAFGLAAGAAALAVLLVLRFSPVLQEGA